MLAFLMDHLGTIVISLVLAAIVCAIIVKLIKDKKHGKLSCGCGCAHCAMADTCHKQI